MQQRLAETSQHRLKMVLRRTARPTQVVAANQLPQMLWPALFHERFADLLPGLTRQAARAYCSVALLRLEHCASINEAEPMLGQRGEPPINMTNLLHRLLPWTHTQGSTIRATPSRCSWTKPAVLGRCFRLPRPRRAALVVCAGHVAP